MCIPAVLSRASAERSPQPRSASKIDVPESSRIVTAHRSGTRCFGKGSVQTVIPAARQSGALRLTMAHALFMGRATYPTCRSRKPAKKCRPTSLVGRQCETAQSTGDRDDPPPGRPARVPALPPVIGVSGSSPRDHAISITAPDAPLRFRAKGNFARDT